VKQIKLRSKKHPGLVALIDDEDYDLVSRYRWHPSWNKNAKTFYAIRNISVNGKRTTVSMHRLILGLDFGDKRQGDHRNFNGLDCQRHNLRIATTAQNMANTQRSRGSSRFKGVAWHSNSQKWVAMICIDGKRMNLGRRNSEIECAYLYDKAALKYFGEYALTNEMMGLLDG